MAAGAGVWRLGAGVSAALPPSALVAPQLLMCGPRKLYKRLRSRGNLCYADGRRPWADALPAGREATGHGLAPPVRAEIADGLPLTDLWGGARCTAA